MIDPDYVNIRQILGSLIGRTLLDITQHDPEEFAETQMSYVQFHFDDGSYVKFPISEDGFSHNCEDDE
jgi:hypothetical protein